MRLVLFALAFLLGSSVGEGPTAPAAHNIRLIPVAPQVALEVLDWGGSGPALVFLAGFGSTGHIFDDFAPQFTGGHRVIAITRRGFGESSRPGAGYDTRTLVQDLTSVLDTLGIRRANFVGHSFAGSEMSYLGVYHNDRVEKLVYVDASYDFSRLYGDARWKRAFPVDRPPPPASNELGELRRWYGMMIGPGVPDHELRNFTSGRTVPSIEKMMQEGAHPTDISAINAPTLALWAMPRNVSEWYPYWRTLDSTKRVRLEKSFDDQMAVRADHVRAFGTNVPNARVISIAGARHFILLSHSTRAAAEIRSFLSR